MARTRRSKSATTTTTTSTTTATNPLAESPSSTTAASPSTSTSSSSPPRDPSSLMNSVFFSIYQPPTTAATTDISAQQATPTTTNNSLANLDHTNNTSATNNGVDIDATCKNFIKTNTNILRQHNWTRIQFMNKSYTLDRYIPLLLHAIRHYFLSGDPAVDNDSIRTAFSQLIQLTEAYIKYQIEHNKSKSSDLIYPMRHRSKPSIIHANQKSSSSNSSSSSNGSSSSLSNDSTSAHQIIPGLYKLLNQERDEQHAERYSLYSLAISIHSNHGLGSLNASELLLRVLERIDLSDAPYNFLQDIVDFWAMCEPGSRKQDILCGFCILVQYEGPHEQRVYDDISRAIEHYNNPNSMTKMILACLKPSYGVMKLLIPVMNLCLRHRESEVKKMTESTNVFEYLNEELLDMMRRDDPPKSFLDKKMYHWGVFLSYFTTSETQKKNHFYLQSALMTTYFIHRVNRSVKKSERIKNVIRIADLNAVDGAIWSKLLSDIFVNIKGSRKRSVLLILHQAVAENASTASNNATNLTQAIYDCMNSDPSTMEEDAVVTAPKVSGRKAHSSASTVAAAAAPLPTPSAPTPVSRQRNIRELSTSRQQRRVVRRRSTATTKVTDNTVSPSDADSNNLLTVTTTTAPRVATTRRSTARRRMSKESSSAAPQHDDMDDDKEVSSADEATPRRKRSAAASRASSSSARTAKRRRTSEPPQAEPIIASPPRRSASKRPSTPKRASSPATKTSKNGSLKRAPSNKQSKMSANDKNNNTTTEEPSLADLALQASKDRKDQINDEDFCKILRQRQSRIFTYQTRHPTDVIVERFPELFGRKRKDRPLNPNIYLAQRSYIKNRHSVVYMGEYILPRCCRVACRTCTSYSFRPRLYCDRCKALFCTECIAKRNPKKARSVLYETGFTCYNCDPSLITNEVSLDDEESEDDEKEMEISDDETSEEDDDQQPDVQHKRSLRTKRPTISLVESDSDSTESSDDEEVSARSARYRSRLHGGESSKISKNHRMVVARQRSIALAHLCMRVFSWVKAGKEIPRGNPNDDNTTFSIADHFPFPGNDKDDGDDNCDSILTTVNQNGSGSSSSNITGSSSSDREKASINVDDIDFSENI